MRDPRVSCETAPEPRYAIVPQPRISDRARGWTPGDFFTAEDDPDRVSTPWTPPDFLLPAGGGQTYVVNPVEALRRRAGRTTFAEELELPFAAPTPGHSFAKVVHGVLSPEECSQLLAATNSKQYNPALLDAGGGFQVYLPEARSSSRCVVDCKYMASYLMNVLHPHLPKKLRLRRNYGSKEKCAHTLHAINERCRFLCYQPGQKFRAHYDGCYSRPADHASPASRSALTLQLYLHDVDPEQGGATTFMDPSSKQQHKIQPRCGSALIFTQDIFHEGSKLISGLKYTMRTDVMYAPPPEVCMDDLAIGNLCARLSEAELEPITPESADCR